MPVPLQNGLLSRPITDRELDTLYANVISLNEYFGGIIIRDRQAEPNVEKLFHLMNGLRLLLTYIRTFAPVHGLDIN
jgi:hypothetical protein